MLSVDLGKNQGIMMPKGMLYRFYATSEDECLVMLRIGAVEGVENTRTTVTFRSVKETSVIALEPPATE